LFASVRATPSSNGSGEIDRPAQILSRDLTQARPVITKPGIDANYHSGKPPHEDTAACLLAGSRPNAQG
jgi:hypothetical protein